MQSIFHPARQQAHDLVERLTLVQVAALINLFEPLARAETPLFRAPFCDELPVDADEAAGRRKPSGVTRDGVRTPAA